MQKYSIALIAAVFTAGVSGSLQATDLMTFYQLAEAQDPQIRAATANYLAEQQVVPQTRAALLPQISGLVESSETTIDEVVVDGVPQPSEDSGETFSWNVNLSQSVYDHSRWQRLRQANALAAGAEADYIAAQQELILRVAEAYFNVLAAQDTVEFAEAETKAVGQQLEQAKQRFEVGLIAITDVKESQAQYDQAVASEIAARNVLSASREALWALTSQYPEDLAELIQEIPLRSPEPDVKEEWVDKALAENLSLLAAQFQRRAAQLEISAQRGGHFPSLTLTARHGYADAENQVFGTVVTTGSRESETTTVGINLSVPIFSGGGIRAQVKEAVYRRDAARENEEGVRRLVIQQTRNAYQNVIADISRVKALQQALISSEAAYRATEAGFEVGTRNAVEVLLSLRNTFSARRDYAQARYDYLLDT
ncbi:MAG TPA: TolC family outer membrane protein, partial [Gammaproteobacteria bacterium]